MLLLRNDTSTAVFHGTCGLNNPDKKNSIHQNYDVIFGSDVSFDANLSKTSLWLGTFCILKFEVKCVSQLSRVNH